MKVALITFVLVIIAIGTAITMLSTWDIPAPSSFVERDISNVQIVINSENLDKKSKLRALFEKDKKYIIVCRSGGRSAKVTEFLVENEIDALNLSGGMKKFSQVSTNIKDSLGNTGQII